MDGFLLPEVGKSELLKEKFHGAGRRHLAYVSISAVASLVLNGCVRVLAFDACRGRRLLQSDKVIHDV